MKIREFNKEKCKVWMRINVSANRKRLPFQTKGTDDMMLLHDSKKNDSCSFLSYGNVPLGTMHSST